MSLKQADIDRIASYCLRPDQQGLTTEQTKYVIEKVRLHGLNWTQLGSDEWDHVDELIREALAKHP